jgi:adenine deaminase
MFFPPYGDTIGSIVVKHVNGQLVDVLSGSIYPACVNFYEGKVVRIEHKVSAPMQYLLPGLIDAHIHIESSLLTPYRFAEKAVVHGTTAVVANPHEIANVQGMDGIRFMVEDGKNTPLRFFYTAPSCVPPTKMETSGATIGWAEIKEMLSSKDFVALGEVMNYVGVLSDDPEMMSKIEVAQQLGKPVDGHCPGMKGYDLDRYIMAGMTTEHECETLAEAEEKHRKGMKIMVREGSAAKDLSTLLPFAIKNKHFLITDDLGTPDLLEGHVNALLRKAVAGGMDPLQAIRAATLWPAEHYGLPGGSLYVGGAGDLVVVEDLKDFKVLETWIGGELVAKDGAPLFLGNPSTRPWGLRPLDLKEADLRVPASGPKAKVRVIQVSPDHIGSLSTTADLPVEQGDVRPDPTQDILLMTVVNRYVPAKPAMAFVKGFGLRVGALASSVAHDSHNLIAVGTDHRTLTLAIRGLVAQGGGYFITDGAREMGLELPLGGLMSARPGEEVAGRVAEINAFLREMGCVLPGPFMTLSFQSLLTVPELKLGDRGLFDVRQGAFVDPVLGKRKEVVVMDESP